MGTDFELNLSGSQWTSGQPNGQNRKCGRRGVEGNKFGAMVTTEVVRKPPPSGGGGLMCSCTGEGLPLQPTLELSGAQQKILKNKTNVG